MPELLTNGVLKVGIFDSFWRKFGRDPDPSITHYQSSPEAYGFTWCDLVDDPARVDVVMASWGAGRFARASRHPRRVLYLQETAEHYKAPAFDYLKQFELVLSNEQRVLDALPDQSKYMTLFGIRMPPAHYANIPVKIRNVSLMGSMRSSLTGNALRWRVYRECHGFDSFGFREEFYWKSTSLALYRFQICIENACYKHWATDKLWDPFALEVVPIYWGGITDEKLTELGFSPDGIIRWNGECPTLQALVDEINAAPDEVYGRFSAALSHNRRRVLQLPCGEIPLREVICKHFALR